MLQQIRDTAETIARGAGALLLDYTEHARNRVQATKSSAVNLVTEADEASEQYIIAALQDAFPDHYIHGEESGGIGDSDSAQYHWFVDPIDGTTNYAHGFPVYAVNLGMLDSAGTPLVGVTYDPTRDELFAAVAGQGATLNGAPIHVSETDTLLHSLLASGFAYDRHTVEDNNAAQWAAFIRRAQGVRRAGSAALDFAYVACGRLDGYWERGPSAWDVVPGLLIVREAGGVVTDYAGESANIHHGAHFVASNGRIHEAMRGVLADVHASLAAEA